VKAIVVLIFAPQRKHLIATIQVPSMKLTNISCVAVLIALGVAETLHNLTNVNAETFEYQNLTLGARSDSDDSPSPSPDLNPADDVLWHESKCRGMKLMLATTQNPSEAERFLNPLASHWDGDMRHDLATWGYKEGTSSPDNDFPLDGVKPMLDAIGISTQISLYGGPNYCFSLTHCNSDIVERDPHGNLLPLSSQQYTVNGRKYRVSIYQGVLLQSLRPLLTVFSI